MTVLILTVILSPEATGMKDKEIEGAAKLYLKDSDVPFCQRIEHTKVLSEE